MSTVVFVDHGPDSVGQHI